MLIRREIYLNPYEPAAFSLRAPMGLDLTVEATLRDQAGQLYTADLEMTLQLVGRSTAQADSYAMPATDLANGKATALVTGDGLNDVNGYNAFVYGTMGGLPAVIAMGKVLLYQGGVGLEPQTISYITNIPLTIVRGEPVTLDLKLWRDESKSAQYVGATVIANLYDNAAGTVKANMTVTPYGQPNEVRLTLTADETAALPVVRYWDVVAVASGKAMTLLQGEVTMT
jgi:hypothetical protein